MLRCIVMSLFLKSRTCIDMCAHNTDSEDEYNFPLIQTASLHNEESAENGVNKKVCI